MAKSLKVRRYFERYERDPVRCMHRRCTWTGPFEKDEDLELQDLLPLSILNFEVDEFPEYRGLWAVRMRHANQKTHQRQQMIFHGGAP